LTTGVMIACTSPKIVPISKKDPMVCQTPSPPYGVKVMAGISKVATHSARALMMVEITNLITSLLNQHSG
jgi:hypothetical protein